MQNRIIAYIPVDAPRSKVIRAFKLLGFVRIRKRSKYITLRRKGARGLRKAIRLPNSRRIKEASLIRLCEKAGIPLTPFLSAYYSL